MENRYLIDTLRISIETKRITQAARAERDELARHLEECRATIEQSVDLIAQIDSSLSDPVLGRRDLDMPPPRGVAPNAMPPSRSPSMP